MEFGKAYWRTFECGCEREWLLTNGIGGFASSTLIGANTRRYHGLLVASLRPPVERHLILSKIDESIEIENKQYNLYSFKTQNYTMNGYLNLQRVIVEPLPVFIYNVKDVIIEKSICMVYGENTVCIVYRIINSTSAAKLKLTPLINFRDYHHVSRREHMTFSHKVIDKGDAKGTVIYPYNLNTEIKVLCSHGSFISHGDDVSQSNNWFYDMYYPVEYDRGLSCIEDHYIPGTFEISVEPNEDITITVVATIENGNVNLDGRSAIQNELIRIKTLKEKAGYKDEFAANLVAATDNFIVNRNSTDSKTIVAGYPWFTDWGRDAMIAFTGLTLVTGRFDDARQILYTYSKYVRDGLLPNVFPDGEQSPAYNTVDAALWYFEAVKKYVDYTKDFDFIREHIISSLEKIVNSYINGTKFDIFLDKDHLISAGNRFTQLTWMDAKVDDWVVTPRHGKAVEVNSLWYNALRIMEFLEIKLDKKQLKYNELAEKVKASFVESFWNEDAQCLFDVINEMGKDAAVRPNQVIAVSLSYPVLSGEKAEKVIDKVWKELYTAYGIRSLSQDSYEYKGVYAGDRYKRDGSYHQGTVWTWPLGHFITGFLRVKGKSELHREIARGFFDPFKDHLKDACVGSISEIFDGDEPLTPRGCFAQAWSVAEILRAYVEGKYYIEGK